jgi:hypothetical protein
MLIDHQQPVEELSVQVPITPSYMALALDACGRLGRILMPSPVDTVSKELLTDRT